MKIKITFLFLLLTSFVLAQKTEQEAQGVQKFLSINKIGVSNTEALQLFAKEYHLDTNYTFKPLYANTDKYGNTHQKMQQYYKNIKVEFGIAIVHSNANGATLVNGELYNFNNWNITPQLSNIEAFNNAKTFVNAQNYLWENAEQANLMRYEKPTGELVLFSDIQAGTNHLALKFDIYATKPISRQEVFVDATTGKILFADAIIKHADELNKKIENNPKKFGKTILTPGNAATRYSGNRVIETSQNLASEFVLQDLTRANGVFTFNCQKVAAYQDVDFVDNDNNWTSAEHNNANRDNAALDAQWGSEKTYDFWMNTFGRNSFDDNGSAMKSYVHYDLNFSNAFWNGAVMTYGDGAGPFSNPFTTIDICGHEIGHGVCSYTAGLVYQNESGAMNEGFSDIWGACIEHYGRMGTLGAPILPNVWIIAEDLGTGGFRSMNDPNSYGDPDTYFGTNWYTGTGDNGGVHTNSGVLNKWFYLLTEGGTGTNNAPSPDTYNVTGIGITKAAEIAYFTERDYLTPNATFNDARNASIAAANSVYCADSPEVVAVTNAWFAVNVGNQYVSVANDVALQTVNNTSSINCGDTATPVLVIKNQGLNPITTIDISYVIDSGTTQTQTWTGNLPSCDTTNYSLALSGLSRGAHLVNLMVTTTNDGRAENNYKDIIILVNDAGVVNVINTFTDTTDELIVYDEGETTTTWVRGVRGPGPMNSQGNTVYTTNLSGNYADMKKGYIVSQCYDLSNATNPQISFSMKYDLEADWDIVYVEYTTDFGANWMVLGEMGPNWYNSDRTPQTTGEDCYNCVGAQWTGTNTTNTTYTYPLNALNSPSSVIFRIVFHSDQLVNELGVSVDNFVINGVLANPSFTAENIVIYPNPSNGIYTISMGNITATIVEVYDLTGKVIQKQSTATTLDLSSAATGIYFVKITAENQSIVKRVIKK